MEKEKAQIALRLRQNLSSLLKDCGMTAAALARKTGVSKQVLSDWMAGVQPRRLDHLYKVAQALGVSIEALCFSEADGAAIERKLDVRDGGAGSGSELTEIRGRYEVYMRRIDDAE